MERRVVIYSGRVQGVGFRATTRHVAGEFQVSGWARNEPDGSVRTEVQGEPAELDRFLAALRDRMSGNIHNEVANALPTDPGEAGFGIRYY